ncbi:hypothetical protein CMI47_09395 [Candidatus Pacearchaeota archaeon]|nr:hypothetical protein [Candidatus Pacearchaeota archaeon]
MVKNSGEMGTLLALGSVGALVVAGTLGRRRGSSAWDYRQAQEYMEGARDRSAGRPLDGKGTRLMEHPEGFSIRYHDTDVVIIKPRNRWVVHTGGWDTPTTRQRINEYSPANVFAEKGLTWLQARGRNPDEGWGADIPRYMMEDGSFTVNSRGRVLGAGKPWTRAEIKEIDRVQKRMRKDFSSQVVMTPEFGGTGYLPPRLQDPGYCYQCRDGKWGDDLTREDCEAFLYAVTTGVWGGRPLMLLSCLFAQFDHLVREISPEHRCEAVQERAYEIFYSFAGAYMGHAVARTRDRFFRHHRRRLMEYVRRYGMPRISIRDLRR